MDGTAPQEKPAQLFNGIDLHGPTDRTGAEGAASSRPPSFFSHGEWTQDLPLDFLNSLQKIK
jgi:hypothetical protein